MSYRNQIIKQATNGKYSNKLQLKPKIKSINDESKKKLVKSSSITTLKKPLKDVDVQKETTNNKIDDTTNKITELEKKINLLNETILKMELTQEKILHVIRKLIPLEEYANIFETNFN